MSAYYNEIDPYAAQWLRNLIAAGHIAPGDVDERSILEVKPDDLRGYEQCHFFAGIGGWSYALRLAGWPDDRPVWTGSCPCQPFSAAGKQRGSDDERHLWPAFFDLIRECGPGSVFGEQVAGAAGLAWLDHVCADLEGAGYAAAAADLCAAGAGAPHIRQRLYWVAHTDGWHPGAEGLQRSGEHGQQQANGDAGALAHGDVPGLGEQRQHWLRKDGDAQPWLDVDGRGTHGLLADMPEPGRCEQPQRDAGEDGRPEAQPRRLRDVGLLGDAGDERLEIERRFPGVSRGASGAGERQAAERADALSAWADIEWIECSDGARPTQPGLFPLAHGIPNRVGRLRAYGNAIVPQVAAVFVMANVRNDSRP